MTPKHLKKYLAAQGHICPFCDSNDLRCTNTQAQDYCITQDVECGSCGNTWTDIYTLTGVSQ